MTRTFRALEVVGVQVGTNGEDALLSVAEAARRLGGISKWTVHSWLSKGRLQRTKVGSRTMIRASELARIIEDGGKSAAPRRGTVNAS